MELCRKDFRVIFLFKFKLGDTAAHTVAELCTAFGPSCVCIKTVERWFRKFRTGDFSLEDAPIEGRPVEIDDALIISELEENPALSTVKLSERLGVSEETIRTHLHKMGRVWKLGKWVPHDLTLGQKNLRLTICLSLLQRQSACSFLNRIVTGDEKWVEFDNETRQHYWVPKGTATPARPKQKTNRKKLLLCVWWNCKRIVHHEFLNPGESVTADVYSAQLERVQSALLQKQPSLVNRWGVILQHDNARPHIARATRETIQRLNWEVLPHPPYSPDLAPSDYHLFLNLQNYLKGKQFDSEDRLKSEVSSFFDRQDENFFDKGISALVERWSTCVASEGDYFC